MFWRVRLTFAVRFKISRCGLLQFDTILPSHRFETAVENACRIFYSSMAKTPVPYLYDLLKLRRRMRSTIHGHSHRIASLHENGSRTHKLAHKAFTRRQVADNTARCNPLERVLAVPRNEVAVVDDVLFAFAELKETFQLASVVELTC